MTRPSEVDIRTAILTLAAERGPDKSLCPSEVARAMVVDWRPLLKTVRAQAVTLMQEGRIDILRKGKPVAGPDAVRGVIRLRIRDSKSS